LLGVLPLVVQDKTKKVMEATETVLPSNTIYQRLLPAALCQTDPSVAAVLIDAWPPSSGTLPKNILLTLTDYHNSKEGVRLAQVLVISGANTIFQDHGRTLLETAIGKRNWNMAGFFVSQQTQQTETLAHALHIAITCARSEDSDEQQAIQLVCQLVAHGVDINVTNHTSGRNICHLAAARKTDTILKWAFENNVNPALADVRQKTPVHVAVASAVEFKNRVNLQLLLNHMLQSTPERLVQILAADGIRAPLWTNAIKRKDVDTLVRLLEGKHIVAGLSRSRSR
jgi:hypothetical protein